MSASQRILARIGPVAESELDELQREIEEAKATLARLEAVRAVAWMAQVHPEPAEKIVVVEQRPIQEVPAPEPPVLRLPQNNGNGKRRKRTKDEIHKLLLAIARRMEQNGPITNVFAEAQELGEPYETLRSTLTDNMRWFLKDGRVWSLSPYGHEQLKERSDD